MKKAILITSIAALLGVCAYQAGREHWVRNIDYDAFYAENSYQQVTPTDQIIKGQTTAVQSVRENIGDYDNKFTIGNDFPDGTFLEIDVAVKSWELVYLYKVEKYNPNLDTVFFLFEDDTKIVGTMPTEKNYIKVDDEEEISYFQSGYKQEDYGRNYIKGLAYAWEYNDTYYCVSEKPITSVWSAESDATIHLLAYDDECPIWSDYFENKHK